MPEAPIPAGFAGYKVGTLHLLRIEDNPYSPWYGQEVFKPATVIETPPLIMAGFRVYEDTPYGLRSLGEVWASDIPRDLERVFTVPEKFDTEKALEEVDALSGRISSVRGIFVTQPRKAGIHKKKPEVMEIPVGGSVEAALKYVRENLGQEVMVGDVFSQGGYIDVIAVTKGKGYQGVVKRFGVKILPRWHKHRKGYRRTGTVGPQKPSIMFYQPRAGQHGFHQRTEYNKRILLVSNVEKLDINPKGGWPHYGLVRGDYILVEGSVPGPPKRLIKMRFPIRPPRRVVSEPPKIVFISTVGEVKVG